MLALNAFEVKVAVDFLKENKIIVEDSDLELFRPLSKSDYDLIYREGMK